MFGELRRDRARLLCWRGVVSRVAKEWEGLQWRHALPSSAVKACSVESLDRGVSGMASAVEASFIIMSSVLVWAREAAMASSLCRDWFMK